MRMKPSTRPSTSSTLTRHQRSLQHGLTRIFLTLLLALAAVTGSQFSPGSTAAAGIPHTAAFQPSQRELTTIEPKAAAATSHQRWDGPLKFYLRVGSSKQHPHPTNRFLLIVPIAPFKVGSMTDTRFADQWNWSILEVGTDSGRYLLRNNGRCLQISSNGTLGGAACNSGNSREQWEINSFVFRNVRTHQCLRDAGEGIAHFIRAIAYTCNPNDAAFQVHLAGVA